MSFPRLVVVAAGLLLPHAPLAAAPGDPPAATGGDLAAKAIAESVAGALDREADPCVDFYRFACGGWLDGTTLAADQSRYVRSFSAIDDHNREYLRTLIEEAAAKPGTDPDRRRIGDFFGACMDEAAIESAGLAPFEPWFAKLDRAATPADLFAVAGELQAVGADVFFDLDVFSDLKDPRTVVAHFAQGGTGLPERDYYLSEEADKKQLRAAYEEHVARLLELAGSPSARADAAAVVAFETELARASRPAAELRAVEELHHRLDRRGLVELAPLLPWDRLFAGLGVPGIEAINVMTPEFFVALDRKLGGVDPATLRAYLRFHLLRAAPSALPSALYSELFDFFGRKLAGQEEPEPRWKRCITATESAMGEALGKLYVAGRFTGESKAIATEMIDDLVAAFDRSLPGLGWMDAATREAARGKAKALGRRIGYPDRFRDYGGLAVGRQSHFANSLAAARFEGARLLAQVGQPVDRAEWPMSPQEVNASYNPLLNIFTYPAGILQPPFFHKDFPAAMNYGAIGYVMGHELTHGFDDMGRKFDAEGRLADWWSPEVVAAFEERTACVERQYSTYEVEPGIRVDGELTAGENIADNGGLKQAWDAYQAWKSRHRGQASTVAGLSDEQLFFVAAAQTWCTEETAESLRLQVATDVHSPGRFRVVGPLANHPNFAATFSCAPGTPMNPSDKCEVW